MASWVFNANIWELISLLCVMYMLAAACTSGSRFSLL